MGYTLAFFGETGLNKNLVFDCLADHFRLGPPDADGYYVYNADTQVDDVELVIAVDTATGVEALDPLNEWSARAGLAFTLVSRPGLRAKELAGDAGRIVTAPDVPEKVAAILTDAIDRGHDVGLALFAEPDQDITESDARLIRLLGDKVAVYCVGDAMLPLRSTETLSPREPEQEEISVVFSPAPYRADGEVTAFLDVLADGIDTAQRRAEDDFDHLRKLIDGARGCATAGEEELPVDDDGQYMLPLPTDKQDAARRAAADEHSRLCQELENEDAADIEREFNEATEGGVTAPGRKRTAAKTRREWLDPETGEWKPIGRGRPRKDIETREVEA